MKKFFTMMLALVAVVAVNATQVDFNFSDPSAFGFVNPAQGEFTQVTTGSAIAKDGIELTVTFSEGNGFRFYSNKNTGQISLRGYNKASFTISAPEGSKLYSVSVKGSNLGDKYVSGDLKSGEWVNEKGAQSISAEIIQSTVYFDEMTVIVAIDGEDPGIDIPTTKVVSVAEAIADGMKLDSAATSKDTYEVTGFVVNSEEFSLDHDNQIWWMADDAANEGAQEFEAYACVVKEGDAVKQVIDGDKVKLTGRITKYYDKTNSKYIIEIKNGTAEFIEKAEGDHELPVLVLDTITVAEAMEIGNALPMATTNNQQSRELVVKGYVVKANPPKEGFNDQTWFMSDDQFATYGEFEAYQCTADKEVVAGDFVYLRGKIINYGSDPAKNTIEIKKGTATHGEGGSVELEPITVAAALEIAAALQPEKGSSLSTDETYAVQGFIVKVKNAEQKTYYMADEQGAYGDFQAYRCASIDYEVAEGDEVIVTGKIMHYYGEGSSGEYHNFEISGGQLKHLVPLGIESVTLTDKAHKVMIDGVMYIVRDGKMFDVRGAQVR